MATIKLRGLELELHVPDGENLLKALKEAQLPIRSLCNGQGQCGECRVNITHGHWYLLPPNASEQQHLGNVSFLDGRRLACFVKVFGEIEVDISPHLQNQAESHRRLKGWDKGEIIHATTQSLILTESHPSSKKR